MPNKSEAIYALLPEIQKKSLLEIVFKDVKEGIFDGKNKKCAPNPPKSECA